MKIVELYIMEILAFDSEKQIYNINIDSILIRPHNVHVTDRGKINMHYDALTVEKFEQRMDHLFSTIDLTKTRATFYTCEGFASEKNTQVIYESAIRYNDPELLNRIIFTTGSLTFPQLYNYEYQGINLMTNCSFITYMWANPWWDRYRGANLPAIDFQRSLENTFCVLYRRASYDRLRITRHLIEHHLPHSMIVNHELPDALITDLPNATASDFKPGRFYQVERGLDSEFSANRGLHEFSMVDMAARMKRSFVNVISETNFYENNSNWITEKTIFPMLNGFPFVISSTANQYRMMHGFGFRTFSDFWSEDFDSILDHEKRLQAIIDTLDYIQQEYNTPVKRQAALEKMQPILEHNQRRMSEWLEKDILWLNHSKVFVENFT